MEVTGIITDIKRFAVHDGPGIRVTVFFKGCLLSCWWCHNPECQKFVPELFHYENRCIRCLECVKACEQKAVRFKENFILIERNKCNACGACEEVCPTGAMEIAGKRMQVKDVIEEVEKERPFLSQSDGGLTLSGGEPLLQEEFALALLREAKKRFFHTAVDTSGFVKKEVLLQAAKYTDLFLYDIKSLDDGKHRRHTGVSNKRILENLEALSKVHPDIEIRIPVIPGFNDSEEEMMEILKFLRNIKKVRKVSLLPFHKAGEGKYKRLGRESGKGGVNSLKKDDLKPYKKIFEKEGFLVKIGG